MLMVFSVSAHDRERKKGRMVIGSTKGMRRKGVENVTSRSKSIQSRFDSQYFSALKEKIHEDGSETGIILKPRLLSESGSVDGGSSCVGN